MTIPTAEQLEITFRQAGQIRLNNPQFENDSTYWVGGHCNWGGSHNLKVDCQNLAKGFGKMESLERISEELRKCTSKSEFDNKKRINLTKCDELINGLSNNNAHSCMFGICIIWSDSGMSENVQRFIEQAKNGISNAKSALNNETYSWVEEIRRIKLEIKQIEQQMRENKQKAMNETDPIKKAKLIELIEEGGKSLIQKQNQLAQMENRLNFNAGKYVKDMVEAMKKAIEGRNIPRGSGGNRNPHNQRTPRNPNNPNPHGPDVNLPGPDEIPDPDTNSATPSQNNQQLLIFGAIALVVIYFLMSQKTNDNYDY